MVVDLKALKHNIKQQQAALPAGSRILAVIKADAYGHGAVPVAHAAKEAGVDGFCVAMLDEGLELRNAGIDQLML
ncbi:alanine racemase, partial [Agathobacter rectalis]|uniref:alanine racemase n=1 Tax=Agathobacter rectalis TaxID=39491 RepID=UPI0027D28510